MSTTAAASPSFISRIEALPPVNPTVERILAITTSRTASAADVAAVLSTDPTISAKILRIANSPFYGACRRITQVSRAVVLLGSVAIRNLVTAICAQEIFSSSARTVPEYKLLWRHAIAVASGCDLIARRIGYHPPEEAFLGGLLHDIGQLAMIAFQPTAFRDACHDQSQQTSFLARERLHLGIDHVDTGHRILSQWRLPEILCRVVNEHHCEDIPEAEPHGRLLAIVMLGNTFAHLAGIGLDTHAVTFRRADAAAKFLGLTDSDQVRILDGVCSRIDEVLELFSVTEMKQPSDDRLADAPALWVSTEGAPAPPALGRWVLEHRGYKVRQVVEHDLAGVVTPEDVIIIYLPEKDPAAVEALGGRLVSHGFPKVAIVSQRQRDPETRSRNSRTRTCRLPHLFTLLDIRWAEAAWQQ